VNPYLAAYDAFHSLGEHETPWTVAMEIHLQRGAVVCTPWYFVMARPVDPAWPPDDQTDLIRTLDAGACWHVFAAAGDVSRLLTLAKAHGVERVTYQRRGESRLRSMRIANG
jgi:hypothetical protein